MDKNYFIAQKKLEFYKKKWVERFGKIIDTSGIYILTRNDENGFKYAYIGQAKRTLTRLAQHNLGYNQIIDKSIKKHHIWEKDTNPYGWYLKAVIPCKIEELDNLEQETILNYANIGYQLRNQTSGSQGQGKVGINDNQGGLGYRKGVEYGYLKAKKEISEYFIKYLDFVVKSGENTLKKNGEIKEIYVRKQQEFAEWLKGGVESGTKE